MKGLDNLIQAVKALLVPLVVTIRLFKHLLQVRLVFSQCALAAGIFVFGIVYVFGKSVCDSAGFKHGAPN